MTQEDKELLLKDLCCRLPYGVLIQDDYLVDDEMFLPVAETDRLVDIDVDEELLMTNGGSTYHIDEVKPYLFPLSTDFTVDQRVEYSKTLVIFDESHCSQTSETYDWFNKNHIDYRGLIEKGLAVDATGKNVYEIL